MKYILLVYHNAAALEAISEDALAETVSECIEWVHDLKKSDRHVFSAGLQSVRTATTVRVRNGNVTMTDGPFAETKEFLGGFTIINARDLNEALQIASKFPAGSIGTVEVRPVLEPELDLAEPLDRKLAAAIRKKPSE